MKYMGSKARHAKELLPIILKDHTPDMWYVEPFVGGANMIDKVPADVAPKRLGCDFNEYLIEMWKDAISGKLTYEYVTPELYKSVRENKDSYEKGLLGGLHTVVRTTVSGLVALLENSQLKRVRNETTSKKQLTQLINKSLCLQELISSIHQYSILILAVAAKQQFTATHRILVQQNIKMILTTNGFTIGA